MHISLFMCEQEPKNAKPLTDYTCLCSANMVSGEKKSFIIKIYEHMYSCKSNREVCRRNKKSQKFFFFKLQKTFITFLNPHVVSPLCNNTSLC